MTGACCRREEPSAPRRLPRAGRTLPWLATGLGLLLLPKCPACLAAWLAVATGVGVGATTASHLRTVLVALCLAAALFAIARNRRHRAAGIG